MKLETHDERHVEDTEVRAAAPMPFSRPTTTIPPDHHTATARVFIDGLSVLCTNRVRNDVEVGFIEHEHDPLELLIFKRSSCRPYKILRLVENDKALIEVYRTHSLGMGEFYTKGTPTDDEDCAHLVDLKTLHSGAMTPKSNGKSHMSAKLVLTNAKFYTAKLSSVHAKIYDRSGTKPDEIRPIGKILGADLTCDNKDTGVVVRATVYRQGALSVQLHEQLNKADGPFTISIGTQAKNNNDHMPMIYQVMTATGRFGVEYLGYEPRWKHCGLIGALREAELYLNGTPEADAVEEENRRSFETLEEALELNFKPMFDVTRWKMATQFACQTLPDGDGPLPNYP